MKKLSTNGTRFIHSTLLLDKLQTCFIFTYISDRHIDIYCESDSEEWISIHQQLDTYTTLEVKNNICVYSSLLTLYNF